MAISQETAKKIEAVIARVNARRDQEQGQDIKATAIEKKAERGTVLTEEQRIKRNARRMERYYATPRTPEERRADSERTKAWQKANPERVKQNGRHAWIKKKGTGIKLSTEQREAMKQRTYAFNAAQPWYRNWQSAKQRCNNPNSSGYEFYGGRGISCELSKFDVRFLWDRDNAAGMKRPSLDRIDSDKNYTLDNCRFLEADKNGLLGVWASKARQAGVHARERQFLSAADINAIQAKRVGGKSDIPAKPMSEKSAA